MQWLPAQPAYTQSGSEVTEFTVTLLHGALVCTIITAAWDAYITLRQRRCLTQTNLPPAVLATVKAMDPTQLEKALLPPSSRGRPMPHKKPLGSGQAQAKTLELLTSKLAAANAYALDKYTLSLTKHAIVTAVAVISLAAGWLPFAYDCAVYSASSMLPAAAQSSSEIFVTVFFTAIHGSFSILLELPFSYYRIFVVETRHGFNKQTPTEFVKDALLETFLSACIGLPLVAALVWVIRSSGPYFYVWGAVLVLAVQLIMLTLYPNIIAPLFNTFKPLPDGSSLRAAIFALASRHNFPLTQLFVIDGSRRSAHSNAYFFGFFKNKRIVLFDTLVDHACEEEIVAVLAHELGHWKMKHSVFNMVLSIAISLLLLFTFSLVMTSDSMFAAFGFAPQSGQPVVVGLMLMMSAFEPLSPVFSASMAALSRTFEYQADAFAHALGHSARLQAALVKLQLHNLAEVSVDPLYSACTHSHPPLPERLAALQALDAAAAVAPAAASGVLLSSDAVHVPAVGYAGPRRRRGIDLR